MANIGDKDFRHPYSTLFQLAPNLAPTKDWLANLLISITADSFFLQLTTMAKKGRLSDFTMQETDMFLKKIEDFKQALSDEDEEEKSVIASLNHIAVKLTEVPVSTLFPMIS